jgi:hypothetical protein
VEYHPFESDSTREMFVMAAQNKNNEQWTRTLHIHNPKILPHNLVKIMKTKNLIFEIPNPSHQTYYQISDLRSVLRSN